MSAAYRPLNWANQPQLYSMTCTLPAPTPSTGSNNNQSATTNPQTQSPTTYYFDATLRVEHTQELVCTEHPVQVGPAIVDHAYLRPARVVLEVGMSDAMQSFSSSQYTGGKSKSVSAYQTFKQIQSARVPITLSTRLDTYQNMVLEDVRGTEDSRTFRGFRGSLHFRQIISASVSQTTVSVRPDQTDSTNEGTKGVLPVDPTTSGAVATIP
jgi:hypothetical protein